MTRKTTWVAFLKGILLVTLLLLSACQADNRYSSDSSSYDNELEVQVSQDLRAIYLSLENGRFQEEEFDHQYAEYTSDFLEFIDLAEQFPNAVLIIDHNAVKIVDVDQLKETMSHNQRMLMVGYENPQEKIGIEEKDDSKVLSEMDPPLPEKGFCHFILNTGEGYDWPETTRVKLPVLHRLNNFNPSETLEELMQSLVKNKERYEYYAIQTYNYSWPSSVSEIDNSEVEASI